MHYHVPTRPSPSLTRWYIVLNKGGSPIALNPSNLSHRLALVTEADMTLPRPLPLILPLSSPAVRKGGRGDRLPKKKKWVRKLQTITKS